MNQSKRKKAPIEERIKYRVVVIYGLSLLLFGLFKADFGQIINGLHQIIIQPDLLLSDYFGVGGVGATFVNSGILTLVVVYILSKLDIPITGPSLAVIWTVSGFAFFGKNIFNVWFILLGVYLYSIYQKDNFSKYIYVGLFATSLSPVVTVFMFGSDLPPLLGIGLGAGIGLLIGFLIPPLGTYMLRVHQGFNIYNIGLTAGIVGTVFVSIFKSYGLEIADNFVWTTGNSPSVDIYLYSLFTILIVTGYLLDKKAFKKLREIYTFSGRLVTDFVTRKGFGPTLVNMGINGILATSYILLVGGPINGPIIGGIFTIVGFSGFGKHLKNIAPIVLGVCIAGLTKTWTLNSPAILLAALFSTTLAPIAGKFGWKYGILAGFIHSSVVLNVGTLHGGLNLYNNGFAGGIVAMFLIPIIEAFKEEDF